MKEKKTKKPSKKSGRKMSVLSKIALFLVCFAVLSTAACVSVVRYLITPVDPDSVVTQNFVTIPSGMSVRAIGAKLEEERLIRSADLFYLIVRFPRILLRRNSAVVIKHGVFDITPSMSLLEIITTLADDKQAYIKTSIPEGLTTSKIARILDESKVCPFGEFMESAKSRKTLEKIASFGVEAASCEGFLFPDTYFFYPSMSADEVISIMVENFFANIKKAGFDSISYDKLILASIVEREYRVDDEAPLIASVFSNRIETGVGLYSCATIEYIITEIQGKPHPDVITYDDLKINSPYNTYRWKSLPPTPISNPGMVAIKAAMNPPETDYFYFTLTDSAAGSHTFSTSFKSHIKAGMEFKTKKAN